MNETKIRWAHFTWNFIHGCWKISAGCTNCYAERLSREKKFTSQAWTRPNATINPGKLKSPGGNIFLQRHKLQEPLKKDRQGDYKIPSGSRVFVNSMSDFFLEEVPDEYRLEGWQVMEKRPDATFMILTKRVEDALRWWKWMVENGYAFVWPAHIWLGVSVEHAKTLPRIDTLRSIPAPVRFVSAEPLIGDLGKPDLTGISWLVVGGESGPEHREMDMAWARNLRDACLDQGVAFYFKQDSGYRTELRPYLVEEDGTMWKYEKFPGVHSRPPHRCYKDGSPVETIKEGYRGDMIATCAECGQLITVDVLQYAHYRHLHPRHPERVVYSHAYHVTCPGQP